MADDNEIQPLEDRPTVAARGYPTWVSALLLVLLAAVGAFAWYYYGQVAALGQELAAMTAERDPGGGRVRPASGSRGAGGDRTVGAGGAQKELEAQLSEAREEAQRLQTAAAAAAAPPPAAPAPSAPAGTAAAASPPGASPDAAAMPEPAAGPTVAEPAAKPAPAPPQTLTITFDVNSSYFPDSLNGRLRSLASGLKPDHAYAVELIGSIGNDPVANGDPEDAAAYNRWIAERRMIRIADFLRANAKAAISPSSVPTPATTLPAALSSRFARSSPEPRLAAPFLGTNPRRRFGA